MSTNMKKPLFNADAAEEYFSMMLTCYRDTANDIFRRDNEGRPASEQHYSAEYQKYLGMQIALREVLEYFGKYELGEWISVDERLPEPFVSVLGYCPDEEPLPTVHECYMNDYCFWTSEQVYGMGTVTHWMPIPEPPGVTTDG